MSPAPGSLNPYYLGFWHAGIYGGLLAALLVLRHRRELSWRNTAAVLLSLAGFIYGRRLQYRLGILPPLEALAFPPRELLRGGGHVPLGILCAGIVGVAVSVLLHGAWRQVLDALAVGWAITLGLGRIGCVFAGCCSGVDCHSWPEVLCVTHARGTEVFLRQLSNGVISVDAPLSNPVHALPLYMILAASGILALQLWSLRRGARTGVLALLFLTLYPASQLLLEQLRAETEYLDSVIMERVLLAMLVPPAVTALAVLVSKARIAGGTKVDVTADGGST